MHPRVRVKKITLSPVLGQLGIVYFTVVLKVVNSKSLHTPIVVLSCLETTWKWSASNLQMWQVYEVHQVSVNGVQNTLLKLSWLAWKRSTFFHQENVYGTIKSTLDDGEGGSCVTSKLLQNSFLLFYWVTPHKENRKLSQVSFHFFVDRLVLT